MLKYIFAISLFIFLYGLLSAQEEIQLGRKVISSAGESFRKDSNIYSFTVGEPIIGTAGNNTGFMVQGFQQPYDKTPIQYDKIVIDETCPDIQNGAAFLTNFRGCITKEYAVTWQGGSTARSQEKLKTGWYYFTIESCDEIKRDSVFVGLLNENPCNLTFYTAFSPNQDGANDTWEIDNIAVPPNDNNEIAFFNIWGQEIKSFTNYDNRTNVWDGKNKNGVDLPEGTYYFVLTLSFTTYSGYIELTR